jgi:hypothetical protein
MHSPTARQGAGDKVRDGDEFVNEEPIEQPLRQYIPSAEGVPAFMPYNHLSKELSEESGPETLESKIRVYSVDTVFSEDVAEEKKIRE